MKRRESDAGVVISTHVDDAIVHTTVCVKAVPTPEELFAD